MQVCLGVGNSDSKFPTVCHQGNTWHQGLGHQSTMHIPGELTREFQARILPKRGQPHFLIDGCRSMTKSGLAFVYCVQLFRSVELYLVVYFSVVSFCSLS